jgi:hypothetical protein
VALEGMRTVRDVRTRFGSVDAKLGEAILYQRILEHIHDPEVRQLAHPGLVLRRITPDIIRLVLAGPCGLALRNASEAQRLFDKLHLEGALVERDDSGALRHRPDLRRLMLPLMRRDRPEQVAAIHDRAVAFFEQQPDIMSRAEEIYHRLSLDQDAETLDARWLPGVEPYLYGALDEVPPRAGEYLSRRLGVAPL